MMDQKEKAGKAGFSSAGIAARSEHDFIQVRTEYRTAPSHQADIEKLREQVQNVE
jgi:hypothetical protein